MENSIITVSKENVNVLTTAKNYFKAQHLDFPFIPESYKQKLKLLQPDVFGTREINTSIYDIHNFISEIFSSSIEDYVLFGFGGHGFCSRAIHYYFVNKNLACFYQLGLDSIYHDEEAAKDHIDGLFSSIPLLINKTSKANEFNLIPYGRRLLFVHSDFYSGGWCWIEKGQERIDENNWHANENFIQALISIPKKSTTTTISK